MNNRKNILLISATDCYKKMKSFYYDNASGWLIKTTRTESADTLYEYNNLGQRTMVSNALGQVSYTAYNSQGQTIATWGTSYPVAYEFNTAGRMIVMATTRSNDYANVNLNTLLAEGQTLSDCNIPALDITQWFY
ncbi:MAG: hypothetical protein M0P27_08145, partial [Bacteroidales bacterium]|nr:hypothetical protein [Bacteroidales bacterium]